jgi:hypothetical protein
VLTAGDPASCVAKDAASANIQGDALTFTNSAIKDYTISFSPRAGGAFVQLSANISGIVVDIRDRIGAGVLDVDVTSANCAHHWHFRETTLRGRLGLVRMNEKGRLGASNFFELAVATDFALFGFSVGRGHTQRCGGGGAGHALGRPHIVHRVARVAAR